MADRSAGETPGRGLQEAAAGDDCGAVIGVKGSARLFAIREERVETRVFHDSPHDDWLVLPSWERLHRIHRIEWEGGDPEVECSGEGVAICGAAGTFCIPGFMSRMGLTRCGHCCRLLGIPRGPGNTLNAGVKEPSGA